MREQLAAVVQCIGIDLEGAAGTDVFFVGEFAGHFQGEQLDCTERAAIVEGSSLEVGAGPAAHGASIGEGSACAGVECRFPDEAPLVFNRYRLGIECPFCFDAAAVEEASCYLQLDRFLCGINISPIAQGRGA